MPSGRRAPRWRGDDVDLLRSHRAALAGMRVEAGDGEARVRDAEALRAGPRATIRAGLDDQVASSGQQGTSASGMWIVTGHDGELPRSTASSPACGSACPPRTARAARNSVWPGWRKPGVIEHVLGDRIGDDGRRRALADEADAPSRSTSMHGAGQAGVGPTGCGGDRHGQTARRAGAGGKTGRGSSTARRGATGTVEPGLARRSAPEGRGRRSTAKGGRASSARAEPGLQGRAPDRCRPGRPASGRQAGWVHGLSPVSRDAVTRRRRRTEVLEIVRFAERAQLEAQQHASGSVLPSRRVADIAWSHGVD